ncbi:MAG: hypothetical protein U0L67_02980 [Paludibacteraceae bacterium]|jgi:hypothetical protein|nr:hypothetical protein [Paludibacteraceae bacterium]
MQDNKEAFIELLKSTNRDGVDEVIDDSLASSLLERKEDDL